MKRALVFNKDGLDCIWRYMENGRISLYEENTVDLIEINPLEDLKLDDKVLVWNESSQNKQRGHFYKISKNGKIECFIEGRTSFSIKDYEKFYQISSEWNFWENN